MYTQLQMRPTAALQRSTLNVVVYFNDSDGKQTKISRQVTQNNNNASSP